MIWLQGRGRVQETPPYDANVLRPRSPVIGNVIALDIEDHVVQMRLIASRREREAYEIEQKCSMIKFSYLVIYEIFMRVLQNIPPK